MIIVDTREKRWEHIKAYFDKHGIEYEVRKLDTGDYQLADKPQIVIDRKRTLNELSHNLTNRKDHSRFWKEVRRSREQGTKLIVLCEHGGNIKSIDDVVNWSDKYSGVTGKHLRQELYRVHIAYNVEFLFTNKRSTARKIIELLGGAEDANV